MQQIPFSEKGSIYDMALSRPLDFGIFPDNDKAKFYDGLKSIPTMFRMNRWEFAKWSYLMLKTWTSNNRSKIKYDKLNAAQAWKPLLKETAYKPGVPVLVPGSARIGPRFHCRLPVTFQKTTDIKTTAPS